jgi:predicted PurR-regulated permease PerM
MGSMSSGKGREQVAVRVGFLVALVAASVVALRILAPFFAVLLLSLATSCLLYRYYCRLVRSLYGRRRAAAILICCLLLMAVLVPILITVQVVSREALSFYEMTTVQLDQKKMLKVLEQRREELDRLNRYLGPVGVDLTPQDIYRTFASLGVELGAFFYRQGVDLAKGLVRLVLGFFFWMLILYYLMVDGELLKQWFLDTLPMAGAQQRLVINRFTDMAASLLVGNGFAGLVQGLAGGIVFALVGLPGPALWGVVMAILAFIPVIGMSLVFVPAAIVLMLTGATGRALAVLIPLSLVAGIVEYWLKPTLVGRRAQMHTLLVFLSLLGGLDAFGPVGLLVGPLLMTAFLTLIGIYRDHYRPKIEEPPEDDEHEPPCSVVEPDSGEA